MSSTVNPEIQTPRLTPEQLEASMACFILGKGFEVLRRHVGLRDKPVITQLKVTGHHMFREGPQDLYFLLNGDHMEQYRGLADQGADACLRYYRDHLAEKHRLSDRLVEVDYPCLMEGSA